MFAPKLLFHVANVSADAERPTAQSTSWSMVTLKWWMKPPVEIPTEFPHDVLFAAPLAPVPNGPCHSDAVFGEPGLFHVPHAIDVGPSCARMWPFAEFWPSVAADTNK